MTLVAKTLTIAAIVLIFLFLVVALRDASIVTRAKTLTMIGTYPVYEIPSAQYDITCWLYLEPDNSAIHCIPNELIQGYELTYEDLQR